MNRLEQPRPVRCFVTGASGHLGSFLVPLLLEAGHEVAILLRATSDPWRLADCLDRVTRVEGDLSSVANWSARYLEFQPEIVFHLAWDGVTGSARDASTQLTSNVIQTLQLLELSHRAKAQVFVGIGSQAEYGPCTVRITESQPASPRTAYGVAKYSLSLLVDRFCLLSGIRGLWLRVFSVYGPKDDPRHMLPSLIGKLLRGEPVALTAGEQLWDYLYVEDAARAIYAAAFAPEARCIFNVAYGESVKLRGVVESVRDFINPALPLGFGEVPYGRDQVMHLEGSIDRLEQATGWSPQVPLKEGLERTIEWYRESARG